jgi:DNA mismatch endonuclease Vsr
MRSNRSLNTGPELALRKLLWASGVRGYRLHSKNLPGRPDIVFPKYKVAVMVHGCWWHGCSICGRYRLPRTNQEHWKAKLQRNCERDASVQIALEKLGYLVFVVGNASSGWIPIPS